MNKKNSPDVIFLSETKNLDEFVLKELEPLNFDCHFLLSPSATRGGGLALFWRQDIDLQILSSNQNFIDTSISYKGTSFFSTFVYGAPEIQNRQEVWNKHSDISNTRSDAWFLTGDFNEITDNSEKSGGRERPESSFVAFRIFLPSCNLFDIKHTGNFLSWRGKRNTHLVHCKLDRALANSTWSDLFPNGRSHYLKFEGSGHWPILSTFDSKKKKASRLFRYDRRLRDNAEIKQLVETTWADWAHLEVSVRISRCRHAIAAWNKITYVNSQKKIVELQTALDLAMSAQQTDDSTISLLNRDLLQAYKAEEEFWKQRSKQLWLSLGDKNISYFHAATKGCRARNRITTIEDNSGNAVFEEEQIGKVIAEYFNKIFTSSGMSAVEVVNRAIVPRISPETNTLLTTTPTGEEIREAMFAIHPDKAPGPDGFSASFFQSNWEVVGPAITKEIQGFFWHQELFLSPSTLRI